MITEKQNYEEIFTGEETFYGNIRGKEEQIPDKIFRLKILRNDREKLIAIPEVFKEETEQWKTACPGWRLKDIIDSKGLFLDFGQKRYIKPTANVWAEIRDTLKYDYKRS